MAHMFFIQGLVEPSEDNDKSCQQGCRAQIWTQDPGVEGLSSNIATVYLPGKVQDGPESKDVIVKGVSGKIEKDKYNDFLVDPFKQRGSFDVIHVFSIVTSVLDMYRRALRGLGYNENLQWQWGEGPIKIFPFAGEMNDAIYDRHEQCLRFYYYYDQEAEKAVYTCESLDIVAQKAGQAVLDALQPGYADSIHPQTRALTESFCDLTNLFFLLNNMGFCHEIYVHSKGNLQNDAFFEQMGETFGFSVGTQGCFKKARHQLKISDVLEEPQELSKVFTGIIYDVLSDMYESHKNPAYYSPPESLYRVGNHLRSLVALAIQLGPKQNATFQDIAYKMIELEPNPDWKEKIHRQFSKREVIGQHLNAEKGFDLTSVLFKKSEKHLDEALSSTQIDYLIDLPKPKIN